MANGVMEQFAVLVVCASILIYVLVIRRKVEPAPLRKEPAVRPVEKPRTVQPKPAQIAPVPQSSSAGQLPRTAAVQAESNMQVKAPVNAPTSDGLQKAPLIDVGAFMTRDNQNERILAGISENIRKSLQQRAVANLSPVSYSESKPSNTEYVRVKKQIITPYGHIRFSILKDWIATNMLAIFRRASLEWKTADDLIAFLPAYLEVDAEVLNNVILLIGTSGHNEKLAVPIRDFGMPHLRDCFDFVSGARTAANTPAVLLPLDDSFQVISKGVITQPMVESAIEPAHMAIKVLAEKTSEASQPSYSVSLARLGGAGRLTRGPIDSRPRPQVLA
jgi:hypothetical protein